MKKFFANAQSKIVAMVGVVTASLGMALAGSASAAPTTTPEGVLNTIVDTAIDKLVYWIDYVMDNYLEYIIVFVIGVSLFYFFKRFMKVGTR